MSAPFMAQEGGGQRAALPFGPVIACDFEYQPDKNLHPHPICMVARDLRTGQEWRLWREDLAALRRAPFDTGPSSLFVSYYASAEMSCFLALGWPVPHNVLDLYAEHRVAFNGGPTIAGNSLVGALAAHGLAHIYAGEKADMRRLILDNTAWSTAERAAILNYCASDSDALAALLPRMLAGIDLPRALLRGRYSGAAVARMEWAGVPIDGAILRRLVASWGRIREQLIRSVDADYGVYEGMSFRSARFEALLTRLGIAWPRLASGVPALDEDTFRDMARRHPWIGPLHELRATLAAMRLTGLEVGADDRNRTMLSPFRSITGRNQPSNSKFVFGPARWLRSLIKPPPGWGLAYIDFSSQELAIAAALSGDERMIDAYVSGDPYLTFAKTAGLAPSDATKFTHKDIRDRCKVVVLGVNYGMGAEAMAASAGLLPCHASELLRLHRQTYRVFWSWVDRTVDAALLAGRMSTVFGWRRLVVDEPNVRSVMNFPMQANGAEMMRIAAIAATEAGIEVCAPVHDAFLIAAPLDRLDDDIAAMRSIMARAGAAVTGGLMLRTDAEVVQWPGRYSDPRGEAMWNRVAGLLGEVEGRIAA